MADLYKVVITLDAPEGGEEVSRALLDVFERSDTATVARPTVLSSGEGRVTVEFAEVPADLPPPGSEYRPRRADEPTEHGGREALAHLAEMPADVLLPATRALVALAAARARAGLPARHSITLEVEPAPPHMQDELRHA
jgi:hypothetical protein